MNRSGKIAAWILIAVSFALYSCVGHEVEVAKEEIVVKNLPPPDPVSDIVDFKFHTLVANIPSPLVTYDLLEDAGAPYYKELSNPLTNRNKYYLESSKAMNFGVYMADFGYALLNDDSQKALKYYATAHDLAKDLGFGPVLNEVVNERLISNVGNSDSARIIINDAYKALDKYLRSNDQLKSAGYIITGGWIQTQHIVLNMLGDIQEENVRAHLKEEVYRQQLHIGNLITFLIEYQGDPDVASLIEQLVTVKGSYDKLVDAGDVEGELMEELKAAVSTMRTEITS